MDVLQYLEIKLDIALGCNSNTDLYMEDDYTLYTKERCIQCNIPTYIEKSLYDETQLCDECFDDSDLICENCHHIIKEPTINQCNMCHNYVDDDSRYNNDISYDDTHFALPSDSSTELSVESVGRSSVIISMGTTLIIYDTSYKYELDMVKSILDRLLKTNKYSRVIFVISHNDQDHYANMNGIMNILLTYNLKIYTIFNCLHYTITRNKVIDIPIKDNIVFTYNNYVIRLYVNSTPSDSNDSSIIMDISDNTSSIILTGDSSIERICKVIGYNRRIELLQIPHHGLPTIWKKNIRLPHSNRYFYSTSCIDIQHYNKSALMCNTLPVVNLRLKSVTGMICGLVKYI